MEHPSGWTCERALRQFEPYLLGTLVWVEALAVAEHVEACESCAQRLVLFRVTIAERIHG